MWYSHVFFCLDEIPNRQKDNWLHYNAREICQKNIHNSLHIEVMTLNSQNWAQNVLYYPQYSASCLVSLVFVCVCTELHRSDLHVKIGQFQVPWRPNRDLFPLLLQWDLLHIYKYILSPPINALVKVGNRWKCTFWTIFTYSETQLWLEVSLNRIRVTMSPSSGRKRESERNVCIFIFNVVKSQSCSCQITTSEWIFLRCCTGSRALKTGQFDWFPTSGSVCVPFTLT